MKGCAGFWIGMGAGLLTGAAMGMMSPLRTGSHENTGWKEYSKVGYRRGSRRGQYHYRYAMKEARRNFLRASLFLMHIFFVEKVLTF